MSGSIPGTGPTGNTAYCQIMSLADGSMANGVGLEVFNSGHWSDYVNNTPEQAGSGRYILDVPGYLPAGNYYVTYYFETVNPGTPTSGDNPFSTETFSWDGANVISIGSPVNVTQINGSTLAAANLAVSAQALKTGAAVAGTLTNARMTTDLTATVDNIYAGRVLIFTSGANIGLAVLITAYAVTGGQLTFIAYGNLPAPTAPSVDDTFIIL